MQFIDKSKEAVIVMELTAEESSVRDSWVVAINELLKKWEDNESSKPIRSSLSARGTSDKTAYFEKREKELKERAAERNKKKEKYMKDSGMKYTAQAMANRAE